MHRQRWREIQNREREFFGSDYNPGNYVFTFEDGAAALRTQLVQHPGAPALRPTP